MGTVLPLMDGISDPRQGSGEWLRGAGLPSDSEREILAREWSSNPLGELDSWPEQLRLLVQVMLSSRFPMMIVWGREHTQLYNDAFRPILGTGKHPDALGDSTRETWAEIWDEIGPLFERVYAGESVTNTDHRLLINRNGYDEETFFTYSYSPIHDDSDDVAGLLVVATETTAEVIDRRRLRCIGDLASALVGATSIESVTDVTLDALRDSISASAIEIDAVLADRVVRIASLPGHLYEASDEALIRRVARSSEPIVLDGEWEPGRPASHVARSGSTTRSCRRSSSSPPTPIARLTRGTESSSSSCRRQCPPR